jgi:hypothetical protein
MASNDDVIKEEDPVNAGEAGLDPVVDRGDVLDFGTDDPSEIPNHVWEDYLRSMRMEKALLRRTRTPSVKKKLRHLQDVQRDAFVMLMQGWYRTTLVMGKLVTRLEEVERKNTVSRYICYSLVFLGFAILGWVSV